MATIISHWLKVHSTALGGSNYTFAKAYIDKLFGFSNIAFIIPSHFINIVPYLTLSMLDFFNTIRMSISCDQDQA